VSASGHFPDFFAAPLRRRFPLWRLRLKSVRRLCAAPGESLITHCNRFDGSRVYTSVPIDTFRTHD
jgi:hypothetical protein